MCDGPILADDDNPARWVAVCSRERLTEQTIVCVNVAGLGVLIVQDGERITACERACPHEQADLSLGRVANGRCSARAISLRSVWRTDLFRRLAEPAAAALSREDQGWAVLDQCSGNRRRCSPVIA